MSGLRNELKVLEAAVSDEYWKETNRHAPLNHYIRYWYQKTYCPNSNPAGKDRNGRGLYYTGRTICVVWLGQKARLMGMSECSERDQFNKLKGRVMALGRAWKSGRRERIHNPRDFLYRVGAPWQLWHEDRPERWPDHAFVSESNPRQLIETASKEANHLLDRAGKAAKNMIEDLSKSDAHGAMS